jgi:hypothetical protein
MMNFEKIYVWKRGDTTKYMAFLPDGKGIVFSRKPLVGRVMRTPPPDYVPFVWSTGVYKYKCRADETMPAVGLYLVFEDRNYFHVNNSPDVWYESESINPYLTTMYMMEPNNISITEHLASIDSEKVKLFEAPKMPLSAHYANDFNIIFPRM